MNEKFRNRYRIKSARAEWWDYGWNGAYSVTICTKNRECIFGDVIDTPKPNVRLSEIGQIAYQYWEEIPDHFPFVELGEYVIMPNHLHGIVIIDRPGNDGNARIGYVPRGDLLTANINAFDGLSVETPKLGVSTVTPDQLTNNNTARWKPGTLGVILNQYKRKCTLDARKMIKDFGWQSRFHDHIIRDAEEFERISEYIRNNPANWVNDRFYRRK
jgi:putative transposase